MIKNQVSFFSDLFIQSRDPYYNLPKWTEECLRANKVGQLVERSGTFRSTSELWLKNNEPGFCPGKEGTVRNWVIFEYCPSSQEVFEVKAPADKNPSYREKSVCP